MRGWKDLELVETIYEEEDGDEDHDHQDVDVDEEDEDSSSSSCPSSSSYPSLSLTPSNILTSNLDSIVQAWSLATGIQTDVVVYVQERCFHLHKGPVTSRSGYLRRHLTENSEIKISPPLKITAEAFSRVVDFCYSSHVIITPFNVAELRVAADLLEMTDEANEESLQVMTETYFCKAVHVNGDYASIILRSCLDLLPEAEETASLVSRCIKALSSMEDGDGVDGWIDDVKSLTVDHFQVIADSMQGRFSSNHDLLYRIVDAYLEENCSKLSEEQKGRICSTIDCEKLSPHLIMHAVQNPRMPLRFIVRAMLVEQLNTRHSIISMLSGKNHRKSNNKDNNTNKNRVITLGKILERDAALRQVAQLKASVDATTCKIQGLERDLMNMKNILIESKLRKETLDSGRSASFHFSSDRRVVKGERASASSASLRFSDIGVANDGCSSCTTSDERSCSNSYIDQKKSLKWRLMNGLKTAFRISSSSTRTISKPADSKIQISKVMDGKNGVDEIREGIIVVKDDFPSHQRNRSVV